MLQPTSEPDPSVPVPFKARTVQAPPAIEWTAERKAIVFNMAKWGISAEDIATTVGVSVQTLRKYCRDELTHARIHANTSVAEVNYKMAVSGKVPAATLHWMKTRVAGFKDSVEHTGAVTHVHTGSNIDPKKLTVEQLKALEDAYLAGAADVIDTTAESISAESTSTDDAKAEYGETNNPFTED
jgi:predicted transcriptional regulator